MKIFICTMLILFGGVVRAQPSILLEACNAIQDGAKRLQCFQETINRRDPVDSKNEQSIQKLKNAFASIEGAVNSGLNFMTFQTLALETVKAVSIFKSENKNIDADALNSLDLAIQAYRDSEKLWRASIFYSKDGGVLGTVLNYSQLDLSGIVSKYQLPTRKVFFIDHLPINSALPIVWHYAEIESKRAFNILAKKTNTTESYKLDSRDINNSNLNKSEDSAGKSKMFDRLGIELEERVDGLRIINASKLAQDSGAIIGGELISISSTDVKTLDDAEKAVADLSYSSKEVLIIFTFGIKKAYVLLTLNP